MTLKNSSLEIPKECVEKSNIGDGIVAQLARPPPAMLASHVGIGSCPSCSLIQLPACELGKAEEELPNS